MSKYKEFVEYFDQLVKEHEIEVPPEIAEMRKDLLSKGNSGSGSTVLTEIGLMIVEYLQGIENAELKASEIALGIKLPSRKVSGAMRKLHTDGFVDKNGQNPVIYSLTEMGKEFDIEKYKNENNKD